MQSVAWHGLINVEEFWEGEILDFEVSGEEILLVHLSGGDIKAYQGMCPHQEILLADGEWDEDSGSLICKGHNWELNLRSGQVTNPAGCALFEYPVKIDDGEIRVGIPQDGQRHYNRWSID